MFRIKSWDWKTKTTINRVSNQFITFLLNIENNCLISRCSFNPFFTIFSSFDYFINKLRKKTPLFSSAFLLTRRTDLHLLNLIIHLLSLLLLLFFLFLLFLFLVVICQRNKRSLNNTKTNIILSNNWRIEGVEI